MNYRDMNKAAAALCGIIAFAVIILIGFATLDAPSSTDAVTFYLN